MEVFSKESTVHMKKPNIAKKLMITALAASTFLFGSAVAGAEAKLTTVYYVYMDDTYIGTVSDKKVVEEIIEKELQEMKQANKDITYKLGSKISYVKEQVFHSTANNQQAAEKLANGLTIEVESAAIMIDEKPVVFLESKEAAEEVIKKLKLQYVTEAQLKELEARKAQPAATLPALKENETRIIDVRLSKEAGLKETVTNPKNILTPEQALTFLKKGTIEEKKYTVKDGDVLGSIAEGANLSTSELLSLNPGLNENSMIKIGQELNITVPKPFVEVIVDKEVFKKENLSFTTEIVDDSSMFRGEKKVKQEGKNGTREVSYAVSELNGKVIKQTVLKETVTSKPVNHIIVRGTKVVPSRGEGSFIWPATGGYLSSQMGYRWGKLHKGIDIARPSSPTIKAADNGVVVFAGWDSGGYGNKIIIDHKNGLKTMYAHLSSIDVNVGQTVAKGAKIGNMGRTGNSTGVHLHFEVYKNGSLQNPLNYIKR